MHLGFLVSAMCVFKMKIRQPTERKSWKRCFGSAKKTQGGKDVPALVDAKKCRIEWNLNVKELVVREHYPVDHIAELWKMLTTHHSNEVQNLI